MSTLPSATARIEDQSSRAPVSTDLLALFFPCVSNDSGEPRLFGNLQAMLDRHLYCDGAEYAGLHMKGPNKPLVGVPMPIATPGHIGRTESVHTGTSLVTVAAGANGILSEVDAVMRAARGGTIGTDQILLELSLDGGTSFKQVRLGTGTSYVIPNIGATVSFGHGSLVTGDTILEFEATGPMFDEAGVAAAKTKLEAKQYVTRTWLFIGDVNTLSLGQAIETAANEYETDTERYIVAKFQTRDRRIINSSRVRAALVPATNATLTFAEVGSTGDTITRTAGSFVTDGFQVGDYVRVTGSLSNNVSGKITAVSATVLTLDTADLTAETLSSGGAITAEPSFTFASTSGNAGTITRNRGSWVLDGFKVGDVVTVDGSASNDDTYTVSAVTATVLTATRTGGAVVAEVAGSVTCTVAFEETKSDYEASVEDMFESITDSKRVDIGLARGKVQSTINGHKMRRGVQWADTLVAYRRDVSQTTWEKGKGSVPGWDIKASEVASSAYYAADEFDDRFEDTGVRGGFTCFRTWANDPGGAPYIAMSQTRAGDSILSMTHNMCVANVAQIVCQRSTEDFAGSTMVLNRPDNTGKRTATKESLAVLETKVNADLKANLLQKIAATGKPRASFVKWTAATDDDLGIPNATLHGMCDLELNGTIVHIETTVGVR